MFEILSYGLGYMQKEHDVETDNEYNDDNIEDKDDKTIKKTDQENKTKKTKKDKDDKNNIPSTVRHRVWKTYIGELDKSKCWCCKSELISRANFDCGHIISRKKGGTNKVSNLRPVCGSCNKSMGTRDMNIFIKEYGLDEHVEITNKSDVTPNDIIVQSDGEGNDNIKAAVQEYLDCKKNKQETTAEDICKKYKITDSKFRYHCYKKPKIEKLKKNAVANDNTHSNIAKHVRSMVDMSIPEADKPETDVVDDSIQSDFAKHVRSMVDLPF